MEREATHINGEIDHGYPVIQMERRKFMRKKLDSMRKYAPNR